MPNPQIENGFTRIATEIVDNLVRLHLSGYESQILWAVIRLTYGFNQKIAKISLRKFQEITGIEEIARISEALKSLSDRKIIKKAGKEISFNKDYSEWNLRKTVSFQKLRKTVNKTYGKPYIDLRKTVSFHDGLKDTLKDNIKERDGNRPIDPNRIYNYSEISKLGKENFINVGFNEWQAK